MLLDTSRFLPLFYDPFDSLTAPTFSIIYNSHTPSMVYFYESNFRIIGFFITSPVSSSSFLSMLKWFVVRMTYNLTKNEVKNRNKITLCRYSIMWLIMIFYIMCTMERKKFPKSWRTIHSYGQWNILQSIFIRYTNYINTRTRCMRYRSDKNDWILHLRFA